MIAELNDYDVANRRLMPRLVWTVQSFNVSAASALAALAAAGSCCQLLCSPPIPAALPSLTSVSLPSGSSLSSLPSLLCCIHIYIWHTSTNDPSFTRLVIPTAHPPRHPQMYNLHNSKMSVSDLLSDLKNTSRGDANAAAGKGSTIKSTAASAVLGGRASDATSSKSVPPLSNLSLQRRGLIFNSHLLPNSHHLEFTCHGSVRPRVPL